MSRVPRLLSGQNLASLPLTPAESYLVSQIDASVSELDLAFITGLPPVQVAATLDRLYRLGAIDFTGETQREAPPPAQSPPPPPRDAASTQYDAFELEEQAELDIEKKRRILTLFYQLDVRNYYELLGIDERADKKQVKSAYYAVAPEFHPDKYFRKQLGSFQAKIEAIFARLTLAHDVLANATRRAEYDDYIAQTQRNRAVSAALDPGDLGTVEAAVRRAAAAALESRPSQPAMTASKPSQPTMTASKPSQPAMTASKPSQPAMPASRPSQSALQAISPDEALRLRREALARKLTGGAPRAPTPAVPIRPKEPDPEAAQRAAQALRLRHETAVGEAKRQQLRRYLEVGRQALESQDHAGAANAYRIASSLEPDDPQVQATCTEALRRAATALADGYWKQATYEEGQERWSEASLSYAKVCAGRPDDALAHERVAYTTLRSGSSVRRAVEFARKAVELAPKSPEFRITLARAYLAAGLAKSCHGELDRATELGTSSPKVQTMVAQVRANATSSTKDGKVS